MKIPDHNPDAMSHWIRHDTITWCKIEDDSHLAPLDTSATMNVITADYAKNIGSSYGTTLQLKGRAPRSESSQKHLC